MKLSSTLVLGLAVLTAGVLSAPAAHAAEASNATGLCQGALPSFDTNIRKRPLAVRNEGAGTAFVSCSLPANYAGNNVNVGAYVVNNNADETDVSCTFVDGVVLLAGPTLPDYYPQTITVAPGALSLLEWDAADFGVVSFSGIANLSCSLPPGVDLTFIGAAEAP